MSLIHVLVRRGLIDGWLKEEGEEKERVEKRLGG